jgi:hypothetical protein
MHGILKIERHGGGAEKYYVQIPLHVGSGV